MNTLLENLSTESTRLRQLLEQLLAHSSIRRWHNPNTDGFIYVGGHFAWDALDEAGRRVQAKSLEEYRRFYSLLRTLLREQPEDTLGKLEEANTRILELGVDPPFWRKGMLRLFVTHLATYKAPAGELQEALLEFGISSFVAHNDIEPTLEWQAQIETALATCDALVAMLHDKFHASNWTDQEIGFAMGRGVPAFGERFGETPYGFIGRFQAFNGNAKTAHALACELFDGYRKNKQTQRRMGEVLVGLFEESGSFALAKNRIGYLEELEVLGAVLLDTNSHCRSDQLPSGEFLGSSGTGGGVGRKMGKVRRVRPRRVRGWAGSPSAHVETAVRQPRTLRHVACAWA